MIGVHARQTAHRIAGHKVQHTDDALAGGRRLFAGQSGAAVVRIPTDRQMLDEADALGQLDLLLFGQIVDRTADGW